jgi:hypothetical protein
MRIALNATGAVSRLPIANENDPTAGHSGLIARTSRVLPKGIMWGIILLADGCELPAFPLKGLS